MSQSKLIMARKLCNVQKELMNQEIEDDSLESLLPLCFNECLKQGLMFFFSISEDLVILKLRDIYHDNYELNVKHAHNGNLTTQMDTFKRNLLINTFNLTKKGNPIDNDASSADTKKDDVKHEDKPIQESNLVPPTAIRTVIDTLEKNNESVTRKSIQKYLQMDKMSTDNRRRCIAYLKSMEE